HAQLHSSQPSAQITASALIATSHCPTFSDILHSPLAATKTTDSRPLKERIVSHKNRTSAPSRRDFLHATAAAGVAAALVPDLTARAESSAAVPSVPSFELDEITVAELRNGLNSGRFTARSLTEKYLARIEQIDRR